VDNTAISESDPEKAREEYLARASDKKRGSGRGREIWREVDRLDGQREMERERKRGRWRECR
jgi:hypothetical protein